MEKIVIIDDEKAIGSSIVRLLDQHGYASEAFDEQKTALEYLLKKGQVDLILLDVWMPEMDGYEFLRTIHNHKIKVPVIVMSGHANIALSTESLKSGATDFLEKPFSPEVLLSKVRSALQKETAHPKSPHAHSFDLPSFQSTKRPQCTIKKNVVLKGVGLHSGNPTGLILTPLPAGSGVVFEDIATGKTLRGLAENVGATNYMVTLENEAFKVKLVEHLMATFHIYGIDNVLVKVSNEVPIMDGSAEPFCALIEEAGLQEQEDMKQVFVVHEPCTVVDDEAPNKVITVEPYAKGLAISYKFDLPAEYGNQTHEVIFKSPDREKVFREEIAPCRTFGFLEETRDLQSSGMALGAHLGNALLLHENKVVNSELRFQNEFARHKIIDILGDTYLLGASLCGRIHAESTGHRHNVRLVRKLLQGYAQKD